MPWTFERDLENEVAAILKEGGFHLEREKFISSRAAVGCTVADIVATKDDEIFVLEVKGRSILHPSDILSFSQLSKDAVWPRAIYVIVTPDEPNSDIKALALQRGVSVVKKADLPEILRIKHKV